MQNGTLPFMPNGTLANPLSNVRRCWLAMPPVAGFLEMFAGVPYNREKNESLIWNPPPPPIKLGNFIL